MENIFLRYWWIYGSESCRGKPFPKAATDTECTYVTFTALEKIIQAPRNRGGGGLGGL